MNWIVNKGVLEIDGKVASLAYPVKEARQFGEIVIVVLDVPRYASMTENVFGVLRDDEVLWQIERIPETGTDPANWYVGILGSSGRDARLQNWNGFVVDIDSNTGRVLRKKWFK